MRIIVIVIFIEALHKVGFQVSRQVHTSITPFVGDVRASEIVSLARATLRRGISNNLCTAPYYCWRQTV